LNRQLLNDGQWERIAPLVPGKEGDPGRSGENNRLFVEAVLWMARAGAPWRDLPALYGKWSSVWKRFRRWALKGVFEGMFEELSQDPSSTGLSTAPSSRSTGTGPAQKGD
jgi:transposase